MRTIGRDNTLNQGTGGCWDEREGCIMNPTRTERVQTVVIGGGQAGLSVGYHLARRGLPFVILDANPRVGDSWRQRWDSLRLFTPARFDSLDGMPFPAPRYSFPTKDQMGDYLEAYATHFKLPVRSGVRVDRLSRMGRRFLVGAGDRLFEADQVVVAMSNFQVPRVPALAKALNPQIVQLPSRDYRSPTQLAPGDVLIVGGGNSGAEIAAELVREGRRVTMSGPDLPSVPWRIGNPVTQRVVLPLIFRVVFHRLLTLNTPMGRKAEAKFGGSHATPLIRVRTKDIAAMKIARVPRVTGVRDGCPELEDGRVLQTANVIWCTGWTPGFSWIDLPILDANGLPRHDRGVSKEVPGLFFVGLHFLSAMSSAMIHGVGRDADRIASAVAAHARAEAPVGVQAVAAVS
jgi:putative flavoprotein involved in K+ transport